MADGSLKDIEDIEIGDFVQSYDTDAKEWKAGVMILMLRNGKLVKL